jgi:hypothetical protein
MRLTLGSKCSKPKGTSDSTSSQHADKANSPPDICYEGEFAVENAYYGLNLLHFLLC